MQRTRKGTEVLTICDAASLQGGVEKLRKIDICRQI
jgi:hypothetical protein